MLSACAVARTKLEATIPNIRLRFIQGIPAAQAGAMQSSCCLRSQPAVRISPPAVDTKRVGLTLALLLSGAGCSYDLTSAVMPGVALATYRSFYVRQQPKDDRNLASMIAESLRSRGLAASDGLGAPPRDADVVVLYDVHWAWDVSSYPLSLRIDLRDARSNALLASATSYRSSLLRKSPKEMVDEVVAAIFSG